jgi:hypothetical protein
MAKKRKSTNRDRVAWKSQRQNSPANAKAEMEAIKNMLRLQDLLKHFYGGEHYQIAKISGEALDASMKRHEEPPRLTKYQLGVVLRLLASRLVQSIQRPTAQELASVFFPLDRD